MNVNINNCNRIHLEMSEILNKTNSKKCSRYWEYQAIRAEAIRIQERGY